MPIDIHTIVLCAGLTRASMLQRRNRARLKTLHERYRCMDCRIKSGNDEVNPIEFRSNMANPVEGG
jgi:hypothetical protein